jgi:drug/metabolite transporter (DMT)-like permease
MTERTIGVLFALATAVFWGTYGPTLEESRSPTREWSPFKPYLFIGVAYLVWGVLGGMLAMKTIPEHADNFEFTGKYFPAMKWGFLAGSLGAFGALTLTYAMFRAGSASLVMPIVFGGAVTVTALTKLVIQRMIRHQETHIDPLLWVGMALVAAGIVLVAMYTPHPTAKKPTGGTPAAQAAAHSPSATPASPWMADEPRQN